MLHGICIGIDRYQDSSIPDLSCATADARAIADLLSRRLAAEERNVRTLLNEGATRRNIAVAVDEMRRAVTEDDVALVYFAGHGSLERAGRGDALERFILPYDAALSSQSATALNMATDIPQWLHSLAAADVLVLIFDCCFSGGAGGRAATNPLLRAANLRTLAAPVSLKTLDLGAGAALFCASDEDELAQENVSAGHGIFTRHVLEALMRPRRGTKVIPLTTLYEEVEQGVRRETGGRQQPITTLLRNRKAGLPCLADED